MDKESLAQLCFAEENSGSTTIGKNFAIQSKNAQQFTRERRSNSRHLKTHFKKQSFNQKRPPYKSQNRSYRNVTRNNWRNRGKTTSHSWSFTRRHNFRDRRAQVNNRPYSQENNEKCQLCWSFGHSARDCINYTSLFNANAFKPEAQAQPNWSARIQELVIGYLKILFY